MEKSDDDSYSSSSSSNWFKLMLTCPQGLSPSQLCVDFSESYDRIPHPDSTLENSIAQIWDNNKKKKLEQNNNISFYNGTKFRAILYFYLLRTQIEYAFTLASQTTSSQSMSLMESASDFLTFMGTNLNPLWDKFLVPSEDECKRCQHTSSPLGNGAIVETSDEKIVVLQRSKNVGEFPGYFVFPGGHPEPQEVGITSHQFVENVAERELINKKVSQEMFDSIIREVVEEIGVPARYLSDPLFIGISRRELNVRPTAFFFMKCSLQSEEIQNLYSTAQDGFESTQLYTLSMPDLEKMRTKMPGCHHGGFALYKLMVEALKK
ncbi:hypothetical protein ACFE04_004624 [Oxalis oulophora]